MKKLKLFGSWVALVVCCISLANGKISDRRLCADEECTTIISMAKTLLNYNPIEEYMVPFTRNKIVRVLSKSAGSNPSLWGIEVQGRRGYAPVTHLQESEVLVKTNNLIEVPTEAIVEKVADTPPATDVQDTIDEKTVEEKSIPSETNEINATVSHDTQEQQKTIDDNKVVSDSDTVINEKADLVVEQQQQPDENVPEIIPDSVKEKNETADGQKEIREHDDEEDEGLGEEEYEEETNDVDEDDVKDYAGREPVTEPPVIKKHAYQTGENEVNLVDNADVKLEIIGSEAKPQEEHSLVENGTIFQIESDAQKVEEPMNAVPEPVNVDTPDVNEIENKPQQEKTSQATTELPLADSKIVTATSEIKKEEIESNILIESNTETNEPKSSESIVAVVKIDENLKPDENVSVPAEASESVKPPPVVDEQNAKETVPAVEATKSETDVFHHHIENVLNIVQEPNVPPLQLPGYFDPSSLAERIKSASSERTSGESSTEHHHQGNHDHHEHHGHHEHQKVAEEKIEIPIRIVADPIEVIETTTSPNVVEETALPTVDEIVDVPEIEEEVLPIPDEIDAEELPFTSPFPILDHESSDDIFTSRPDPIENVQENVKTVETGAWYDVIVETIFEGYSSVVHLFNSGDAEKSDAVEGQQRLQAEIDALEDGYCEKLDDGSCPKLPPKSVHEHVIGAAIHHVKNVNYDQFAQEFLGKVVAMADLVILLALTATAVLIFIFGHYCLANNNKESALISKLNIVEKKLLVSEKECSIVKADLIQTRKQLVSIEDSSFGSNDMVIALKQQLELSENEKLELQQQIVALEKELETAAEAGLELNKMVSELLNNQSGSDSIISSVEELQRQLNEQEATTFSINNLLAEKSRENSELQVLLAEKNGKFEMEIEELLKLNDVLKIEKESIEGELRENIHSLETQLNRELETKVSELTKLRKDHVELKAKFESISSKYQLSEARADALKDTLKKLKQIDGKADLKTVIEATDANAKLLALSRENESLKEKLEGENDARNLLEDHVKVIGDEITGLRAEYNQAEKDKLEAQTRLEVLSNYFKEKETQLQKELSVKEALFMKQQGESTSTVERIRNLQDEIQELKSQNDQLRAEIDAQSAAHKAQINAAESRAHDSWLAAKQAERRFEEIRAEAGILRRKLTSLSTNPASAENSLQNHLNNGDGLIPNDMNAPSPIHMESPGSPLMNLVPPNTAPFLPPPPFIGAPPMSLPFMPPPPLVSIPPGEMRPPPLGRLMSPPPPPPPLHPNNRFQPNSFIDDRGRYDNRFNPDSRYDDYPDVSTYETETDFSPPRSPVPRSFYRDRNDYDDEDDDYSPRPSPPPVDNRKRKTMNKGGMSSGSIDSSTSRQSRGGTSKN